MGPKQPHARYATAHFGLGCRERWNMSIDLSLSLALESYLHLQRAWSHAKCVA